MLRNNFLDTPPQVMPRVRQYLGFVQEYFMRNLLEQISQLFDQRPCRNFKWALSQKANGHLPSPYSERASGPFDLGVQLSVIAKLIFQSILEKTRNGTYRIQAQKGTSNFWVLDLPVKNTTPLSEGGELVLKLELAPFYIDIEQHSQLLVLTSQLHT